MLSLGSQLVGGSDTCLLASAVEVIPTATLALVVFIPAPLAEEPSILPCCILFFPFPNQCRPEYSALICSKCPTEPEDYTSQPVFYVVVTVVIFCWWCFWQQLQWPGITLMWQRDFQDWASPQSLAFSHTHQGLLHYSKNLPSILFRRTRVVCLSQTAQKNGVMATHLFFRSYW